MIATAMAGGEPGKAQRILVCDDERHIVRLSQVNLERQGHVVSVAFDGAQAVDLMARQEFDLVVLDNEMPSMTGYEVLVWIRTHDATEDVTVVLMITADDRIEDWEARPYLADKYLQRGVFRFRDLFRK